MNILVIINGWITKISGGDYHILKVAQFWCKNHKVYFLVPKLAYKYIKENIIDNIIVLSTPFEKETNNTLRMIILYLYRILKAIFFIQKDRKFNVVVASSHFLYDVIPAIFLSKYYKSKMVVYIHHLILSSKRRFTFRNIVSLLNEILSLWLIRCFADLVLVVNPNVKKDLLSKKFKPNKIYVTSNGIDIEYINSIKSEDIRYDCCFCGRIVAQKGVFDLLDIWKKVIEVFPEAKLAIVGDGPEYLKLSKNIKNAKLNKNIMLLGYLNESDKIKVFKSSKILLLPSYEEGWGIVIGEAMAAGLPVVCYNLPEIKPIWGDNVVWIPKGNKDEFAQKVVELLKDERLRKEFSIRGVEFVRQYNWKKIAKKEIMIIINS